MIPSDGTGAKTAERAPTTTRRLTRRDPLALVAALGLGQRGVQHGDAVAEALAEAAERLRRERDLRDEHDRAASARERGLARADVDLGLAAARRAVEQDVAAVAVEQLVDARERTRSCVLGQLGRRRLRCQRAASRGSLRSPRRFALYGATSASARAGVEP